MTGHDMATARNVNKADQDHCTTCGRDTDMKYTIQCAECDHWIHYTCSALPLYLLLCLARTNRKYTCETCAFEKFSDPEWTAEASEAMEKMRKDTTPQPPSNTEKTVNVNGKEDSPATPPPTSTETQETAIQQETPPLIHGEEETPSGAQTATHPVSAPTSSTPVPSPPAPSPLSPTSPSSGTQREVPICLFYKKGICMYGAAGRGCRFRHPKICKTLADHGNRGKLGCKLGRNCTMFHPIMCKQSQISGECLVKTCRLFHARGTRRTALAPPTNSPRQDSAAAPLPTPLPSPTPNTTTGKDFLGSETVTELRQGMNNLLKAMEMQTTLLSSLLKGGLMSQPQPPQNQNQILPWFNPIAHR